MSKKPGPDQVMAVVVLIVGWLIYAIASGFALRDAIGLTSATRRQSTADMPMSYLFMWLLVYVAIAVVPVVPTWFLGLVYLTRSRTSNLRLSPIQLWYGVSVLVMLGVFIAVSAHHAFGAPYNAESPTRAWGRYLTHLVPCTVVLGLILLQALTSANPAAASRKRVVATLALTGVAAIGMWAMLFRGWIYDLPVWSFEYRLTAADLFPSRSRHVFASTLGITVLAAVAIILKRPRWTIRFGTVVGAWAGALALTTSIFLIRDTPRHASDPLLGGALPRKLLVIAAERGADLPIIFVLADGLAANQLGWDGRFWATDVSHIQVIGLNDLGLAEFDADSPEVQWAGRAARIAAAAGCADMMSCYLVTRQPVALQEVSRDDRWGSTIHVYPLDPPTR